MLRGNSGAHHLDSSDHSAGKSPCSPDGEDIPVEEQGRTESSDEDDPREMRMKDLDSGVEYNVGKKYTIRDLNTGQMFALNPVSDPNSPEAAAHPVTDFASGKQLSLEEFDVALGLGGQILEAEQNGAAPHAAGKGGRQEVNGIGLKGSAAASKKKSWLNRVRFKKGKTSGNESDFSDSESATSTAQGEDGQASLGRNSGAASVSGRMPVRVHVHRKLHKDLAELCLVQTLPAHSGVVWAMKFSHDGKFLASAGQDGMVYVWEVGSHWGEPPEGGVGQEAKSSGAASPPKGSPTAGSQPGTPEASGQVFKPAAHRAYKGHQADVLDVAWSKSYFLLTASMDKSVRLWHVSMDDCLRVFRHTDFVTALDFHPIDDKHFVSGSIDGKVRLWNIPEHGRVVDYADVHEMVTATIFSADGTRAIVGTMKGKCRFYQCSPDFKLEYQAQIDVKNRRGKASRGRKITGIQFLPNDPTKLLITSNDSRIRLYDGYTLLCKYKGLHNTNTQIRASFSEHGDFILCGSDDGSVYFWTTNNADGQDDPQGAMQEKSGSYESFHAHNDIATVAIFAPKGAQRVLATRSSPKMSEKVVGASESMSRLGLRSKFTKEEAAGAANAGQHAVGSAKAYGQVLLTAGYDGTIKIFENLSPPHWL